MTRWLPAIVGVVGFSVFCASHAHAQGGFSGRWTLMQDRSTVQLPDGQSAVISTLGSDFTIRQTPDRLIVEQANKPPQWAVMLDGSESRTVSERIDIGAKYERTYRGEWRGETFVIHVTETDTWKDGRTATGDRTFELSLNPDGTLRVAGIPITDNGPLGASVYRWLEAVE
jgi:hypothetical protein